MPTALSILPASASPVLRTEIDIVLSSEFNNNLSTDDFTATLIKDDDVTFSKNLYIMSADQALNSIKIKFGGAKSGDYRIQLDSQMFGRVENSALILKVGSQVNSISPTSGSKYGGTIITIIGENFSDEILDNPVKIGNHYCNVLTSS